MNEILEVLRQHWGIILTIAGLFASIFWLKMDSKYAKKGDVGELSETIEHYDRRLNQLESKVDNLPTAQDVAKLEILMTEIKGETKSTNAQMKAISHQVGLLIEDKVLTKKG